MGGLCFASIEVLVTEDAYADLVRIVSWNVSPSLFEKMDERSTKFQAIRDEPNPDVPILAEVVGAGEVRRQRVA